MRTTSLVKSVTSIGESLASVSCLVMMPHINDSTTSVVLKIRKVEKVENLYRQLLDHVRESVWHYITKNVKYLKPS